MTKTEKLTQEQMKELGGPDYLFCTRHNLYHHRDAFYDNPRGRHGKSSQCKTAQKSKAKRLRYQRTRYDSAETLARREVQNALKRGEMMRAARCFDRGVPDPRNGKEILCDGQRLEFHHTGTPEIPNPYDQRNWRVGVWVCNTHHKIRENKV